MNKEAFLNRFDVSEQELNDICKKANVKTLYVFGSSLTSRYSEVQSDIDFLVKFEVRPTFDNFFFLQEGLRHLFNNRKIDLITTDSLKNRIIRDEILASRKELYVA